MGDRRANLVGPAADTRPGAIDRDDNVDDGRTADVVWRKKWKSRHSLPSASRPHRAGVRIGTLPADIHQTGNIMGSAMMFGHSFAWLISGLPSKIARKGGSGVF